MPKEISFIVIAFSSHFGWFRSINILEKTKPTLNHNQNNCYMSECIYSHNHVFGWKSVNTISDFNNYEFIITEILVGEISMNNKLMLSHI